MVMKSEEIKIKVVVRVRPCVCREKKYNQRNVVQVLDKQMLLFDPEEVEDSYQSKKQAFGDLTKRVHKRQSMAFDRVYGISSENTQIFQECISPLVDAVLDGFNCSVFAYGATGAGKTFTMIGNSYRPGLTFLTMRDLFAKMHAQNDLLDFNLGLSFVEVYNEHVTDLLTKAGPLRLRENSRGGVVISGLELTPIRNASELLHWLHLGNSNRTQHPTDANAESSRSHAIFQVHIRMTERRSGWKRTAKLSMIDLAGSERAASTKCRNVRFKESASINKSLLALGNCINSLADGLKHIPYRDSNLTRILKDSLGGNCRTLMVANVSVSSFAYEDTYNTLKYACRAMHICTTLQKNALKSNMPKEFYVKKVADLMAENKHLKAMVNNLQKPATHKWSCDDIELQNWHTKIDAVYSNVIRTQEFVEGLQYQIKSIDLRINLMEKAVSYSRILNSNQIGDDSSCRAIIAELHNQTATNIGQLEHRNRQLRNAFLDLGTLHREIGESKCAADLQGYLDSKDVEILSSKKSIKLRYLWNISTELESLTREHDQALTLACEMLNETYNNDNYEKQELYGELRHLLKTGPTKFSTAKECDAERDIIGLATVLQDIRIRPDDNDGGAEKQCKKRFNDRNIIARNKPFEEEDSDDSYSLQPIKRRKLEEMLLTKSNSDLSKLTTFAETLNYNKESKNSLRGLAKKSDGSKGVQYCLPRSRTPVYWR